MSYAKNSLKSKDFAKELSNEDYSSFDQINGEHSYKKAVPNGYVDYQARTRHGGSVFFFNFPLAREMGLIDANHPDELTDKLETKILETFSIVIINEYDIQNRVIFSPKDVRKNTFMATRYLQLQHPNKQGKTSGDGRGIWNGEWRHQGSTWDVTSSGTGATKLSPAHAQTQKFFKTGDKVVGYGNGYNCVNDGLSAALMSDIFHRNGIETERTLAIISFAGGYSINVRAGKNLFRPAHFFHQLKQGNFDGLKASIDYFIKRQEKNNDADWKATPNRQADPYQAMAEYIAKTFAKISAQFEAEYIFCWLDWDGDNILANGGIIDYGSVRQFGLYHREYRYDDVDRMSTNIPEQKFKAKYIVQNFAQIRHFLKTGRKLSLRKFRKDPILRTFENEFAKVLHEIMLKKFGFSEKQTQYLMNEAPKTVRNIKSSHSYFEKTLSKRGIYKIDDGITADAVFSMQDLHRELPKLLMDNPAQIPAEEFIQTIRSSYAETRDLFLNDYRINEVKNFQRLYLALVKKVSERFHKGDVKKTFLELTMRASSVNRSDRITGDGVLHLTSSIIRNNHRLSFKEKHDVIEKLVLCQTEAEAPVVSPHTKEGKMVLRNLKALRLYREGF